MQVAVIDPTDHELAVLYQRAHIYASADRYLYFGLPICEAARFQIPAVSLSLAAAQEIIVHSKTGFIAKNQIEFSAYLEKLINNPNLRDKMGQSAQKRAQEIFTWEKTAREYLSLFRAKNSGIQLGDEANLEVRKRGPQPLGRGDLFKKIAP